MKSKKVLISMMSFLMVTPMFTSSIFAAPWDGSQTSAGKPTDVSYDNSLSIPDPDNPTNPDWAVKIASSLTFNDTNKKLNASIKIETVNGGKLPTYDLHVGVKSANGYKLKHNTSALDYDLQFEKNGAMTSMKAGPNTPVEVGVFTTTQTGLGNTDIKGEAIMSGTAKEIGTFTDQLTFLISKSAIPSP